jgi:phosphatidylserine synthase
LADIITLLNGACGVMSIFASMRFLISYEKEDLYVSMIAMPMGLFFDFFDGRVARWRKNSSLLGQELDSLADLVRYSAIECFFSLLTAQYAGIFWCGTSSICFFRYKYLADKKNQSLVDVHK